MFTKYVLPVFAAAGLALAIFTVVQGNQAAPPSVPIVPPPTGPKFQAISGAGLVEARMENIPIGVNVPGVVTKLYVFKGQHVKKGDPLFSLDPRDLNAQLKVRTAELSQARAQLHKLKSAPRPEDVPPAEAAVEEARARMNDTETAMGRTEKLYNRQMAAAGDFDKDRFAYFAAKAALSKALAELERIKRGTWKEDIDLSQAAVELCQAEVDAIKTSIDRLTVNAPTDGDILQLNVRLGQFAAMNWKEPMILLGDVKRYHVRVDIDENDLPMFDPDADAVATLKGRPGIQFALRRVYVEPYVVPKQSLTGSNSERVDTRVLQVVYELPDDGPVKLYVGQQMDVYIRAAKSPRGLSLDFDDKSKAPFGENDPSPSKAAAVPGAVVPRSR
jgi:multidrug resistance efflux pump